VYVPRHGPGRPLLSVGQPEALLGFYKPRLPLQGLTEVENGCFILPGSQSIFAETIWRFGNLWVELCGLMIDEIRQGIEFCLFELKGKLHEKICLGKCLAHGGEKRPRCLMGPCTPGQFDQVLLADIVSRLDLEQLLKGVAGGLEPSGLIMGNGSTLTLQDALRSIRSNGLRRRDFLGWSRPLPRHECTITWQVTKYVVCA
jgi:hypothetical protein